MNRPPIEHDLKCWPDPFAAIVRGEKTHEIRKNDRDYHVGDTLLLREWMQTGTRVTERGPRGFTIETIGKYTGRETRSLVTHLTPGGQWGLPNDICVMSIRLIGERGG